MGGAGLWILGVGGGGMEPFGGPYCMMGRKMAWVVGAGGGGGFGSLTAYSVASKMCGSMVIVTGPSLDMLSLGGLLGSSVTTPLRFIGLVQYFSKTPSAIHLCRDRTSDSARTPLSENRSVNAPAIPCDACREQQRQASVRTSPAHSDTLVTRDRRAARRLRSARASQPEQIAARDPALVGAGPSRRPSRLPGA